MIAIPNTEIPNDAVNVELAFRDEDGYIVWHMFDIPLIEIVTCGECKYVGTDATCCLVCCRDGMGLKPYNVYHDDFCSYGERRADERITEQR